MNGISVIIPAYNASAYLAEALESVRAQTIQPDEIIVVDNASTDGTGELALNLGVRLEREHQQGAAHARNRGIAAAKGDLLAFLDADDQWLPDKLALQSRAFREDPGLDAVFGMLAQFISPELTPEEASGIHCPVEASPARLPSIMLAKRDVFERFGLFSTRWKRAEAVEWIVRAEGMGLRHAVPPHVMARRRLHGNNVGMRLREYNTEYLTIIRENMLRRRAAESPASESRA